ncbi:MAG: hypothetical protein HUJ52_03560, partial [Malacoplasma sp.]|nr:hypothetical protein [Malacoplasma sp.]
MLQGNVIQINPNADAVYKENKLTVAAYIDGELVQFQTFIVNVKEASIGETTQPEIEPKPEVDVKPSTKPDTPVADNFQIGDIKWDSNEIIVSTINKSSQLQLFNNGNEAEDVVWKIEYKPDDLDASIKDNAINITATKENVGHNYRIQVSANVNGKSVAKRTFDIYNIKDFDIIMARGGLLRPIEGGTYIINQKMVNDLKAGIFEEHASNLGAIIAYEYSKKYHIPSYIADPVVVDELSDVARISGCPALPRLSKFHALNQKAVARRYA